MQKFYPCWKGEPSLDDVKKNVAEILEFKPDWIVAIGGGSVIDGAKVIWALYENPNIDESRLHIPFSIPKLRKKAKFVAIPTTAGTGSEASSSAIITSKDNEKIPIITHDFIPDLAILDPILIENTPVKIIIPSILDAFSHSIEGFVSVIQNKIVTNLVMLLFVTLYWP